MDEAVSKVPLIEFRGIGKRYGSGEAAFVALHDIDLRIDEGEFVAIMGPSGSGKSTAMNIIGALDRPTWGEYLFQGVHVENLTNDQRALLRRRYLGFVFQGFNLLPRTTALENVELPLVYRGLPAKERHAMAREALDRVGLAAWEHHTPAELSGGQHTGTVCNVAGDDLAAIRHGLDTLDSRLQRQSDHARAIAEYLAAHPDVPSVGYPGLASHPDHDIAARTLQHGFGPAVDFELPWGVTAGAFLDACDCSHRACPAGGPLTRLSPLCGDDGTYIRLIAGLDDPLDIVDSLDQAMRLFCDPPHA